MRSTSVCLASGSPASARSGSRSSASTGRGALRHRVPTANPASGGAGALARVDEGRHGRPQHAKPGPNPGSSSRAISGERQSCVDSSAARPGAAARPSTSTRPRALHADQHIHAQLARRPARSWSTSNCGESCRRARRPRHGRASPGRRCGSGAPRRPRPVRIESTTSGLETRVPQAARLGGSAYDVGRREGHLARVEEDRLAQVLALAGHALLGHLDRHPDELQRLRSG